MTLEPPLFTQPPKDKNPTQAIWLGFALGMAPVVIAVLLAVLLNQRRAVPRSTLPALFLVIDFTVWPLLAIIMSAVRSSRRFGLGMVIGVGLGWLVLLAFCGGSFKF